MSKVNRGGDLYAGEHKYSSKLVCFKSCLLTAIILDADGDVGIAQSRLNFRWSLGVHSDFVVGCGVVRGASSDPEKILIRHERQSGITDCKWALTFAICLFQE